MKKAAVAADDDLVEYGYRRVIITITAVLCALLEIVDTTIVNVALTDMRGSLGATRPTWLGLLPLMPLPT